MSVKKCVMPIGAAVASAAIMQNWGFVILNKFPCKLSHKTSASNLSANSMELKN